MEHEPQRFSVVIPTKNNEATIGKCLSSLMDYYHQGYFTDIVVVDGRSTDETLRVAKGFPVRTLSDEGRGFNVACDLGWKNTEGELVIFLDADAYLGEGFFPEVQRLFSTGKVGVVGCNAKAVVTDRLTRTIAQEWQWVRPGVGMAPNWLRRLYDRFALGTIDVLPGGPCQIVTRPCLEALGGFGMHDSTGGADIFLSRRAIQQGWDTKWWPDAPVYHYPRRTLRSIMREFRKFGLEETYREKRDNTSGRNWNRGLTGVVAHLGSPAIGLMLAIRYRNPLHLLVYPLPRYAWVSGYIAGRFQREKSARSQDI